MVKYKQAVAVISNAPPVRLTYPRYAKVETPPLPEREKRFQRAVSAKSLVVPSASESLGLSATQTPAVHPEKVELEKPQKPEAGKTTRVQWEEVNMAFTAPQSQKLEFEPEYDPDSLDEDESPLFDLGSRGM